MSEEGNLVVELNADLERWVGWTAPEAITFEVTLVDHAGLEDTVTTTYWAP